MDFMLKLRLKIRDFFRKYWIYAIMIICGTTCMLAVNKAINSGDIKGINESKNIDSNIIPIIDNRNEPLSEINYEENIKANNLISKYMEYCNNKEYESAYNLLDEDFKNLYFEDIDNFKKYINVVFKTKRIYNTEYYSNTDNIYIYNVKMMDDILASRNN